MTDSSAPSPEILRSTLTLHDVARHVIVPPGVVTTQWPAAKEILDRIGISFDRWQQGLAQLILAKRADGKFAATIGGIVLSIARQTGKTFVVRWIVFALCVLIPKTRALWTSHHGGTTFETLQAFDEMAHLPAVAEYVEKVITSNGKESVVFRNGSLIMFGARESGGGRGKTDITLAVFDEAQKMSNRALQAIIPTQNVAKNPLTFFIGTPPTPWDDAEVFTEKRNRALAGRGTAVYVEISCDPVPVDESADEWIRDRSQWALGNPAYRTGRVDDDAMERLIENLTIEGPEGVLREGLGLWDAEARRQEEAWPWEAWLAQLIDGPLPLEQRIVSDMTVCLCAARNRRWVYVARCGERSDGLAQVELVARLAPDDVPDWLLERKARIREVTGQARGAGLTSELIAKLSGDPRFTRWVVPWEGANLTGAFGRGLDAITSGTVATLMHPDLEYCLGDQKHPRVAWKELGGGRVIDGTKSKCDQAPLTAWFGALGMRTRPQEKQVTRIRVAPVWV